MAFEGYHTGNIPDDYDERDVPLFTDSEVKQILSQRTAAAPPPAIAPAKVTPTTTAPAASPGAHQQPSAALPQPVGPHLQATAPATSAAPAPQPAPVPPKPVTGAQPTLPGAGTKVVLGPGGKPAVPAPQPGAVNPVPQPKPDPQPKPVNPIPQPKPDPQPKPVNPVPQPKPDPQPKPEPDVTGQPINPAEDIDSDPDVPSTESDPPWFDPDPVDRRGAVILPNLPPVYDQWHVGSCSINASCAALRYAYCKYTGKSYDEFNPSRLYAWYYARISRAPLGYDDAGKDREGDPVTDMQVRIKSDEGVHNRGSIHVFLTKGVCTEELWPYGRPHVSNGFLSVKKKPNPCEPLDWDKVIWQAQPSAHQGDYKDITKTGLLPRAISYYRIYDPSAPLDADEKNRVFADSWRTSAHPPIELLERAIDDGFPIIFATALFPGASLGRLQVINGVCIKPPPRIVPTYGAVHALLAVGYHRERRMMLVQNSWGTNWPASPAEGEDMKGRFWMPYEWFTDRVYGRGKRWITNDFWVIKYSEPSKAPPATQGAAR